MTELRERAEAQHELKAKTAVAPKGFDFLGSARKETISAGQIEQVESFAKAANKTKGEFDVSQDTPKAGRKHSDDGKREAIAKIQAAQRGVEDRRLFLKELASEQGQEGDAKNQTATGHMGSEKVPTTAVDEQEAAKKIQSLQRGRQCRQQLAADKEKKQKEVAAVKIQKLHRGNSCRLQVATARKQKEAAAVKIQKLQRGNSCRLQVATERKQKEVAAVKIQKVQRGNTCRQQIAAERALERQKHEAAKKIQSLERGRQCRQEGKQRNLAATKIQKIQRGKAGRKEFEREKARQLEHEAAKARRNKSSPSSPRGIPTSPKEPKKRAPSANSSKRLRTYQLLQQIYPANSEHELREPQGRAQDGGDPASQKFTGCQRFAAKLAELRARPKPDPVEQQTMAAMMLQVCLRSLIARQQMMAVKIQAFYRGWKGRRRFRSKLAAHRAQERKCTSYKALHKRAQKVRPAGAYPNLATSKRALARSPDGRRLPTSSPASPTSPRFYGKPLA